METRRTPKLEHHERGYGQTLFYQAKLTITRSIRGCISNSCIGSSCDPTRCMTLDILQTHLHLRPSRGGCSQLSLTSTTVNLWGVEVVS